MNSSHNRGGVAGKGSRAFSPGDWWWGTYYDVGSLCGGGGGGREDAYLAGDGLLYSQMMRSRRVCAGANVIFMCRYVDRNPFHSNLRHHNHHLAFDG